MITYRYPSKGPMELRPWTKPDGKPRCTTRPKWLCPKCELFIKSGAIKSHRETCGAERRAKDAGRC